MDTPARLFRWVKVMPLPDILSLYFPKQNLLLIDRELYDRLDEEAQRKVLRTAEKTLRVRFPPNHPPVVTSGVTNA